MSYLHNLLTHFVLKKEVYRHITDDSATFSFMFKINVKLLDLQRNVKSTIVDRFIFLSKAKNLLSTHYFYKFAANNLSL